MILLRLVRAVRGLRRHKAVGLASVLGVLAVAVVGNAVCFVLFDGATAGDAMWYSLVSMTTIGYGDLSAESTGARLGTVFFIMGLGMAAFTVLLGMGIDWATDMAVKGRKGMGNALAADHIVIVNFPSASRVLQLVDELQSDPQHAGREIVITTSDVDELPFDRPNVLFIRGPVLEQETYERARIHQARMAIVLAPTYESDRSDALVASAAAVIDSLHPEIHLVAECLNEKHRMLFSSVRCDAIVFSQTVSGNLLAQEAHDPGIAQLVDVLTSNIRGTTLYTTLVTADGHSVDYLTLSQQLLERDINVLCVNRGPASLTSFRGLTSAAGDRLVYVSTKRLTWPEMLEAAGT